MCPSVSSSLKLSSSYSPAEKNSERRDLFTFYLPCSFLREVGMEKKPVSCKKSEPFCFSHVFWVAHFLVCVAAASSSSSWDGIVVTEADYQGLQAFKHDLVDPNGVLRSWNDTGYGACSGGWAGIKCSQGQVIVIQLPWRGLGGRITEKISQFQGLRKLSLHDNELVGSIPISIGLLPNLRGVQLYNNMLSGSIPASLGMCPLIQTIDLGNNSLSGELPATLVNSTRLFRLNVSYNSLSGSIPYSVTQSRSLIYLALERNNLSGAIPDSWGGDSFQLEYLTLDHNSFNGSIPVSFSNLKNLTILDLSYNRMEGRIPAEVGNIYSLGKLDLSNNNLAGEIPGSIGELPNLYSFNVSYNNLSGSVPIELSQRFNASAFVGNLQLCGFSASAPCSPPPAPEKRHRRMGVKDILLIAFAVSLVILMVICCLLIVCLMRKTRKEKEANKSGSAAVGEAASGKGEKDTPTSREIQTSSDTGGKLVHFDGAIALTADGLLCATAEIIGKSTYGTVYKATMEDGIEAAVKRLRERITKGQKDFEIEVNALGKIRHPHLLALRAYYLGPKGEKLLVFDYMVNGSLATFLHARAPDTTVDWSTRMKIAKGMTRGLIYLHNNVSIIHGNLTSTNILLYEHINAKISDYGLSRLMTASANANVIATAGALGYRAPELSKLKKATTKSDVYSLGVIMLELLTGKSPGEEINGVDLPQWVASIVKEEWTKDVFDLELMRDSSVIGDELLNTLKLALHCVDPSPSARPEASQILQQLEEIRPDTAASSSGEDIIGGGAVSSSNS